MPQIHHPAFAGWPTSRTSASVPSAREAAPSRLEQGAVWLVLAMQSGALLPLMAATDGELTEGARGLLRLSVLPIYAITLILAARYARPMLIAARRSLPLVALVALTLMSVLWSIAPALSLRRAIALILTLMLSQVLAVMFTPRQLTVTVARVTGLCLAGSLIMALADPGLAFMPGETALRGVYLNKNVLGWIAALATVSGAVTFLDPWTRHRRTGLVVLGLGVVCVLMSQSSSSLLAAVMALMLALAHVLLARAQGLGRVLMLSGFLVLALLLLLFLSTLLVPLLQALGKDATLTGRVPLWALVDARIAARPWLGYGYQAFWTQGSVDAWGIWTAIGWTSPHAHNGYRDTLLSLGITGAALLAVVLVQALMRAMRLHLARPAMGWLWPNALLGHSLILNLSESALLFQNDLQWILTATVVTMAALHAPRRC